jgi:YidC/Oxa1 family membrane protein insertase
MNFFGILARPLGLIMTSLYSLVGSYGITLVILTVVIKLLLYPLYKKQIMSTAGMSDLQPKMQHIQNQYAGNTEVMNQKIQELYKEEGVSPAAGCLPMVIQMFVIMGLFELLRYPLKYVSSQAMVFAVHESFLWIKDLSQPDPWILPVLSGVATFISFYMSQQNGAMGAQQGGAMMTVMKYGFPIMIIWLAKSYAAGLAMYWFVSQFIQIFYNIRFNTLRKRMAEEKKNKKKTKRKPVRAGQGVR